MRNGRLFVKCMLLGGVSALFFLSGCVTESRRDAIAGPILDGGPRKGGGEGAAVPPREGLPVAGASTGTGCTWVRLAVSSADIENWQGRQLLVVKTRTPSVGWKVVLEELPGTDSTAREFVLLGTAPEKPQGAEPQVRTVVHLETFGSNVEQVVIYGEQDVLVLPPR